MAKAKVRVAKKAARLQQAESYKHPESESPMRPDVGTQAQFKKKKPPVTYRYDSSLSPALDWDGQNGTRELGEWLLAVIEEAAALPHPTGSKNRAASITAGTRMENPESFAPSPAFKTQSRGLRRSRSRF